MDHRVAAADGAADGRGVGQVAGGVSDGKAVQQRAIENNEERLRRYPQSAAIYLPGGTLPPVGSILKQTNLARTIATVAE